jgi:hypothetical protein
MRIYGPRQDPYGEAGVLAIFIQKILATEPPDLPRSEPRPARSAA